MSTIGNITVGRMSGEALRAALEAGGYTALVGREAEIKRAAKSGRLLWSSTRLTTTDASRIDERPRATVAYDGGELAVGVDVVSTLFDSGEGRVFAYGGDLSAPWKVRWDRTGKIGECEAEHLRVVGRGVS